MNFIFNLTINLLKLDFILKIYFNLIIFFLKKHFIFLIFNNFLIFFIFLIVFYYQSLYIK